MMPDLWMPGAARLDIGDHQSTDGGPAKAIAHITWDRNATAAKPADLVPYETLRDYFGRNPAGRAVAPHLLWDPFTGRVTQFVPANCRSKSLADSAGGTRTNRAGYVVIQVEALFFPHCTVNGKVYPRLIDTPCKGWAELHAWIKAWGVPDAWPSGRPEKCTRNEKTWQTKGGWYPHAAVPENDHSDPLTWPAFPTAQEDDMPLTDDDAKKVAGAVWGQTFQSPTDLQGAPRSAATFLRWADVRHQREMTQLAALSASVTALTGLVGKDVDTATVVAAVQKAIADAVIKVDVDVTGTPAA